VDIGCSVGLLTRIAHKNNHTITGYDLDNISLKIASLLNKKIKYKNENFLDFQNEKFDVISATSLLSVLKDQQSAYNKLISLLKDENSLLIIIEPTNKLSVKNVLKLCNKSIKNIWKYKGFFLWAKAREGKAVDINIIDKQENITVEHIYLYNDMIRISKISILEMPI
jgi:2-polyprenyl-3-methyl-5-hydroxy-6-metoxy-1,4-benzoquinol methylase